MKNFIKCALGAVFVAVPLWAHAKEAPYGVSALAIPQNIMKIEFSGEDAQFQLKADSGHYVLSEHTEPVAACGLLGRIEAMASALDFHQGWHGLVQQSTVNVGVDWSWCAPKSHNQAQGMNMPVKGVVQVCLRVITATERINTTPAPLAVCGVFSAEWQGSVNWSPKTETELVWLDFGKKKLKKADPKNSDAILVTNQKGVRYHMTWPQREASHCKPYRDFVSSSRLLNLVVGDPQFAGRKHQIDVAWCDESSAVGRLAIVCLTPHYSGRRCAAMQLTPVAQNSELAENDTN